MVVTLTRTLGGYAKFDTNSQTGVASCTFTFDTYAPVKGFVACDEHQGDEGPEVEVDDDPARCRFGWGLLLSLTGIHDMLSCLLLPSGDPFRAVAVSYEDSILDRLLEPLSVIDHTLGSFRHGYYYLAGNAEDGSPRGRWGRTACQGPKAELPLGPLTSTKIQFEPLNVCEEESVQRRVADGVRQLLSLVFIVGLGLAMVRPIFGAFGIETPGKHGVRIDGEAEGKA
jgi:hypothetical protein